MLRTLHDESCSASTSASCCSCSSSDPRRAHAAVAAARQRTGTAVLRLPRAPRSRRFAPRRGPVHVHAHAAPDGGGDPDLRALLLFWILDWSGKGAEGAANGNLFTYLSLLTTTSRSSMDCSAAPMQLISPCSSPPSSCSASAAWMPIASADKHECGFRNVGIRNPEWIAVFPFFRTPMCRMHKCRERRDARERPHSAFRIRNAV